MTSGKTKKKKKPVKPGRSMPNNIGGVVNFKIIAIKKKNKARKKNG